MTKITLYIHAYGDPAVILLDPQDRTFEGVSEIISGIKRDRAKYNYTSQKEQEEMKEVAQILIQHFGFLPSTKGKEFHIDFSKV